MGNNSPKIPVGAQRALLQQYKPCGRRGCIHHGIWIPKLCVTGIGGQKVHKTIVTMFLCKKHRDEFDVAGALTKTGREEWDEVVKKMYGHKLNWDTLGVEWVHADDAKRILLH